MRKLFLVSSIRAALVSYIAQIVRWPMVLAIQALKNGRISVRAHQKSVRCQMPHLVQNPFPCLLILSNTHQLLVLKVALEFSANYLFSSHSWSALREAVANLYNVTYRQNKPSKYTYENVCIVPGGRSGLSRIAAVIGDVYTVN